ncbi:MULTISPECIES: hypothetical protein [Streptomyces]|nr:hypothetical protein [Streptomyces actuosus]MBM4824050.1 hypothetical protein [Streptomyces actuosus]
MADRSPVLRIITSAARESLKPLGLAQRGRSRLWIDDQGWWFGVVEFTPPRTAGSGLHVGAMWLWHDVDHLAFHVDAVRVSPEPFRSEEQFTPLALELSRQAAASVTALREKFPVLPEVVRYLTSRPVRRGFLWDCFDAGIAAALVGDPDTARDHFERILREDPLAPWRKNLSSVQNGSTEDWNNIAACGGSGSVRRLAMTSRKTRRIGGSSGGSSRS